MRFMKKETTIMIANRIAAYLLLSMSILLAVLTGDAISKPEGLFWTYAILTIFTAVASSVLIEIDTHRRFKKIENALFGEKGKKGNELNT